MKHIIASVVAALLPAGIAAAGGETWPFDLSTTGEDVIWVSPTPIDPNLALYEGAYVIDEVVATVLVFGFPQDVDVTGFIPGEFLSGSASTEGPAPLTFFEANLVFPPPPDDPAVQADIFLSLDLNGFGNLAATNIVFGSIVLPPPLGEVEVVGLAISGEVTIGEADDPNDTNGDGVVDVQDLVNVITNWGPCKGDPCIGDVNGDGVVDVQDLVSIITGWG